MGGGFRDAGADIKAAWSVHARLDLGYNYANLWRTPGKLGIVTSGAPWPQRKAAVARDVVRTLRAQGCDAPLTHTVRGTGGKLDEHP
jgi:hypothetical protein